MACARSSMSASDSGPQDESAMMELRTMSVGSVLKDLMVIARW